MTSPTQFRKVLVVDAGDHFGDDVPADVVVPSLTALLHAGWHSLLATAPDAGPRRTYRYAAAAAQDARADEEYGVRAEALRWEIARIDDDAVMSRIAEYDRLVLVPGPHDSHVYGTSWPTALLTHPHLVVAPTTDVSGDAVPELLAAALVAACGRPDEAPTETERKYLLQTKVDRALLGSLPRIEIEQTYLTSEHPGTERRVRARREGTSTSYWLTTKTDVPDHIGRVEDEREVGEQEYRDLLEQADPSATTVVKSRYMFLAGPHRFELDQIVAPLQAFLLEVELLDENQHVELPSWLGPVVEVTGDPAWRNSTIARRRH